MGLRGQKEIANCLKDKWVVMVGASEQNLMMVSLVNQLVPFALMAKRNGHGPNDHDGYASDGIFSYLIDVVIQDGKVIHKHVNFHHVDPYNLHSLGMAKNVNVAIWKELDKAPERQPGMIRITYMIGQWWHEAEIALESIKAAPPSWSSLNNVFLLVTVGQWYADAKNCHGGARWCATDLSITGHDPGYILNRFRQGLSTFVGKLKDFCSPGGKAGKWGCTVVSLTYCNGESGLWLYQGLHKAFADIIKAQATPTMRYFDLFTLTQQLPEECISGHLSPASAAISWQVLLSSICDPRDVAPGRLAAWKGFCHSSNIMQACPALRWWRRLTAGRSLRAREERHGAAPRRLGSCEGYFYGWDYALSHGCTMIPVSNKAVPVSNTEILSDMIADDDWKDVLLHPEEAPKTTTTTTPEIPSKIFGCAYNVKVLMTSENGLQVEDREGAVGLNPDTKEWQQWTISDAGDGKFFFTSWRNQQLTDSNGQLILSTDKSDWQKWSVIDGATGRVYITSWRQQQLSDVNSKPAMTAQNERGYWQQWTIHGLDGSDVCGMKDNWSKAYREAWMKAMAKQKKAQEAKKVEKANEEAEDKEIKKYSKSHTGGNGDALRWAWGPGGDTPDGEDGYTEGEYELHPKSTLFHCEKLCDAKSWCKGFSYKHTDSRGSNQLAKDTCQLMSKLIRKKTIVPDLDSYMKGGAHETKASAAPVEEETAQASASHHSAAAASTASKGKEFVAEGQKGSKTESGPLAELDVWLTDWPVLRRNKEWLIALSTLALAFAFVKLQPLVAGLFAGESAAPAEKKKVEPAEKAAAAESSNPALDQALATPSLSSRDTATLESGDKATVGRQDTTDETSSESKRLLADKPKEADDKKKKAGAGSQDRFSFGLARAMASCHVVVGHLYARGDLPNHYVFGWGFTWVPWFFMLSGFILCTSELRRPTDSGSLDYVAKRLVTIYPLYAVGLVISFLIAYSKGAHTPDTWVLVLQAWLLQAWVPQAAEFCLQMQCWFLSCLLFYWVLFPPLASQVRQMSLNTVSACCVLLLVLSYLFEVVPYIIFGHVRWYHGHHWQQMDSDVDVITVMWKFHPLCYWHVFLFGCLLAQLRVKLGVDTTATDNADGDAVQNPCLRWFMEVLTLLGYVVIIAVFTEPVMRPLGAKLTTRLFLLLPLQAAIQLGLAGIPGYPQPLLAQLWSPFNFLESYSYSVYVLQFIAVNVWEYIGFSVACVPFFIFLAACAAIAVVLVQKPADFIWRTAPRAASFCVPALVTAFLILWPMFVEKGGQPAALLPVEELLPAKLKLDSGAMDVRLPLHLDEAAEHEIRDWPDSRSLINPSVMFVDGGERLAFAARLHATSNHKTEGKHEGKTVEVEEDVWHSRIVLGSAKLSADEWKDWHASGKLAKDTKMSLKPWELQDGKHRDWNKDTLCPRETYIPHNKTIVRLVTTGPEDPKLFSYKGDDLMLFNSYPPAALKNGSCGAEPVSQMYLARNIDADHPEEASVGHHLACGRKKAAEKNWIPFERHGKLHLVYTVLPHMVGTLASDNSCGSWQKSVFRPLSQVQSMADTMEFRGSATAVYIDDADATPSLKTPHFLALFHAVDTAKRRNYAHFAYRFSPDPPFEILQVSKELKLQELSPSVGAPPFAFVSGLAVRDRQVIISYTAGDRDSRALLLELNQLDELFAR
eukprot:TRINITY_DN28425_c0_g1_i1.p1 TRINITY_DN28425_c0_g1~~TRINITY_DN28425_c0_g1_i1.p1  ORF type:complete len:1772 (+),score=388.07 TRINITY_DN28425_c0_g1_i1:296-5317(+)